MVAFRNSFSVKRHTKILNYLCLQMFIKKDSFRAPHLDKTDF